MPVHLISHALVSGASTVVQSEDVVENIHHAALHSAMTLGTHIARCAAESLEKVHQPLMPSTVCSLDRTLSKEII